MGVSTVGVDIGDTNGLARGGVTEVPLVACSATSATLPSQLGMSLSTGKVAPKRAAYLAPLFSEILWLMVKLLFF